LGTLIAAAPQPITRSEFQTRRTRLFQRLGDNAIAIITTHSEYLRTGDTHYPYRPHSSFFYLTGFAEPESIAVFIASNTDGEYILFNRSRDLNREIWEGHRAGQEGACKLFDADRSYPIEQFETLLPKLLAGKEQLYVDLGTDPKWDQNILSALQLLRQKARRGLQAPEHISSLAALLGVMRRTKSPSEIDHMRYVCEVSARAHEHTIHHCEPGLYEYQLEAKLRYPAIVGGGDHACVLHYTQNNARLNDGDLVLVDAGAEYQYYCADITRTYPVNGKFTARQKSIYVCVLETQQQLINSITPGVRWDELQAKSVRFLTQGLIDLGILSGSVDTCIETKAYQPFYMHGFGHWLGMDTHDVGSYRDGEKSIALEPGMILTVEPGLYFSPEHPQTPEAWKGIGVRIEDDILVTANGCEVLTRAAPKSIEALEARRYTQSDWTFGETKLSESRECIKIHDR